MPFAKLVPGNFYVFFFFPLDLTCAMLSCVLNSVAELKSIQTSSAVNTKTFDTSVSINLKPPPIDRHKSFDEDDFSNKPVIVKKPVATPKNVTSYSIADLQMATGSFSVEHLLGEGSFGRVYRAQFDDGKVHFFTFQIHLAI